MSKKIYVVFSVKDFILPKLYTRRLLVNKAIEKHPSCEIREF
jgi:hypothetical protein